MRWFKHFVDLSRHEAVTPFLDAARDRFAALGFLYFLLEAVAEHWDGEGEPALTHGPKAWARVLGCHQNLVRTYMGRSDTEPGLLQHCSLVHVTFEQDRCKIHVESIRTWQDEYTQKKGRNRESTPHGDSGLTPARTEQNRTEQTNSSSRTNSATTPAMNQFDDREIHEQVSMVINDWNEMAGKTSLQTVDQSLLPPETLKCLRARVVDEKWWAVYEEALEKFSNIPFLLHGDPTSEKYRNFRASFDFFVQPDTALKILSGNYGKPNLEGHYFSRELPF